MLSIHCIIEFIWTIQSPLIIKDETEITIPYTKFNYLFKMKEEYEMMKAAK